MRHLPYQRSRYREEASYFANHEYSASSLFTLFSGCRSTILLAAWLALHGPAGAEAAADDANPAAESPAGTRTEFARGVVLRAQGGAMKAIVATLTVPGDWPGQQRVRTLREDLSPGVKISYKTLPDVGRQMVVRIPGLADGREARAIVTYEIQSLQAAVPQDTKRLTAPDPAKLDRKLAVHLAPSPHIESNDPALRKAATETTAAAATAWDKVAAVHAWVHGHIKYEANEGKVQSIAETLQQGNGDCDEMNSLAVAMCRASGIPARLVRIPKHCVYEVYLLDGEGQGHWFCGDASRAGAIAPQAFSGGIIMQKGDNISVTDPKTRRPAKKRFLEETATGLPQTPGARLEMRLINE